MASVIDLVRGAAVRLQVPAPALAVGSADPFAAQMLAALADAAVELLARYPFNRTHPDGLWLRRGDGTMMAAVALDTDTVTLDEAATKAALLWRWRSDNGFDYAEDFRAVEERIARLAAEETRRLRGGALQL